MLIALEQSRNSVVLIKFGYAYPMKNTLSTTKDVLGTEHGCRSPRLSTDATGEVVGRLVLALLFFLVVGVPIVALGDIFEDSPPRWEPLLWGGKVMPATPVVQPGMNQSRPNDEARTHLTHRIPDGPERETGEAIPPNSHPPSGPDIRPNSLDLPKSRSSEQLRASTRPVRQDRGNSEYSSSTRLQPLELTNIPPLYVTPLLEGEGVWESRGLPSLQDGSPVIYRTSYRPSVKYPNAIVYMLLFDIRRLSMRLYLGSSEPGATKGASMVTGREKSGLMAITNAFWKQRHSGEAGTIFRGTVVKKLFPGMATLVIYKDGSVDILEWNDGIPDSIISDAKQLKHLIVKDGRVVDSVIKGGQRADSEIGMGFLLVEDESSASSSSSWSSYPYYWGYYGGGGGGPTHTSGEDWFIATRSAFGIRPDGNLVFAIGHHISTKDLAKALVLAGCERAMHGDANPHNVLGNLYFNSGNGEALKKAKLSPDQRSDTLNRYLDRSYPSDFFAFFTKWQEDEERDS